MDITPSASRNLIRSLQRGTVRPGGAKHVHCGHEHWIDAQLEELSELTEDGGSVVHFVRGAYGEGKTHFLYYLEELARDRGWASAHLECRRDKVELDKFETVYPGVIQKLRLFPDSLDSKDQTSEDPAWKLLDLWANRVLAEVGYVRQAVMRPIESEARLFDLLQDRVLRKNLPADFQTVLCAYPRAIIQEDLVAQRDLITWFKGENRKINIPGCLLSKPGQRVNAPGVDRRLVQPITLRPVASATSLDVFRGVTWLLRQCNYSGLILAIDEVEQLARLRPAVRRERALQTLREFVDNTDGDIGLQRVAIYFAATPNMFDDEAYFRSYDALATRIEPIGDGINWRSPVISLDKTMLTKQQLEWVARRIRDIFAIGYGSDSVRNFSDDHLLTLVTAVDDSRYRIAKPRLLCRVVVDELERVRQGRGRSDADAIIADTANVLMREEEEE